MTRLRAVLFFIVSWAIVFPIALVTLLMFRDFLRQIERDRCEDLL